MLVRANLNSEGYTIYVTDLSRIWGETLCKRQIQRRADEIDCTIDPGEGDDQLNILLERIEEAFRQQGNAMLSLQSSSEDDDSLVLTVTTPLPSPLPELRWTMYLHLLPAYHLQTEVILPLACQAQNLQSQVQALIHKLHEKDRVISKITDRLEQSGNDLTICFPGVSNVKFARKNSQQSQRDQLARYICGLGNFDEDEWNVSHKKATEQMRVETGALEAIMRSLPAVIIRGLDVRETDSWWRELKNWSPSGIGPQEPPMQVNHDASQFHTRTFAGASQKLGQGTSKNAMANYGNEEGENDVRGRETPPRLITDRDSHQESQRLNIPSPDKRHAITPDDESTEDDDVDLDTPPAVRHRIGESDILASKRHVTDREQRLEQSAKDLTPASLKSAPKLGTIGGRMKRPRASELDYGAVAESKMSLGIIGGKSRTDPADRRSDSNQQNPGDAEGRTTNKESIVERDCISGDAEEAAGRRSRPLEKAIAPKREETSIERTERKREALKWRLEEKPKAPSKKKRKF